MAEVTEEIASNSEVNQEQDYLQELVGEGKKFSTVDEAAKALAKKAVHADTFIETLKKEKAELAQRLQEVETKTKTTEEIVELITRKAFEEQPMIQTQSQAPVNTPGISVEDVDSRVAALMQERALAEKRKAQKERTWLKLKEAFGSDEDVKLALFRYAGNNQEKREAVDKLGFTDPDALITVLKSSSDREIFSQQRSNERIGNTELKTRTLTWSKAKEIKKNDPVKYQSLKFQQDMQASVAADPDFYNK